MPDSSGDKTLLTQVLGKVNALPPGAVGSFALAEIRLLRGFVASRRSEALGDRERGFLAHIQSVVDAHAAVAAADEAEAGRRKNTLLRNAIDKCMQGQMAEVSPLERALIANTAIQLDAIAEPSASHLRLRALVFNALQALEDFNNAMPVESLMPDTQCLGDDETSQVAIDAEAFFAGGARTRLREFGEIPLEISARVVEREGNVEISGNVPDDVALVVKDGSVVVYGQCDGSILADGAIQVHGNVAGPWTISTTGSIQCERVLGGANLYAPQEKIICTSIERPGRLYSGVAIEVAQDVRGGSLIAPVIQVGGALRSAHAQVLKSLVCAKIEGDPRDPSQVIFRNLLTAEDYRADVSDEAWHLARELSRFRYRQAVGKAMLACLREDLRAVECARLLAISGRTSPDLKSLRVVQAKSAYLSVVIVVGEFLEQVLLEATELEGDAQSLALGLGTDEAHAAAKFLEREVAHLSEDLTQEPKAQLVSATKHLLNLAKKIRDCAGNRPALEESAHTLLLRLTEWRDLRDVAKSAVGQAAEHLRDAIGKDKYDEADPVRLAQAVAEAVHEAGPTANSAHVRSLKALAEIYTQSLAQYTHGVSEVGDERERLEGRVLDEPSLLFGEGRNGDRYLRAEQLGPHVVVATSPGLALPHTGGDNHAVGRSVRIDRALSGAVIYRCDGLQVRQTLL